MSPEPDALIASAQPHLIDGKTAAALMPAAIGQCGIWERRTRRVSRCLSGAIPADAVPGSTSANIQANPSVARMLESRSVYYGRYRLVPRATCFR